MESAFDIDIAGDGSDDLPPGVQPGSLGGTDDTPTEEEAAIGVLPGTPDSDEPDATAPLDIDLGGEDPGLLGVTTDPEQDQEFAREENGDTEVTSEAVPPLSQPTDMDATGPVDPPTPVEESEETAASRPKPKRQRKKSTPPKAKSASGTVDRIYLIFEIQQVEVGGQIVEAPIRRDFTVDGQVVPGLKARNRDLALRKAGKLFGHGYEGTLVAVPEGMWEPTPVRNKPREHYHVEVG